MKVKGKYDDYWEMKVGGPYDAPEEQEQVFKCTGCGAETATEKDFNGEPQPHKCKKGCPVHEKASSDWRPGSVSRKYAANYAMVFGHD